MSRVAKMPIELPGDAEVTLVGGGITVKGPLGSMSMCMNGLVGVKNEGRCLFVSPNSDTREANAMSGTFRAIVNNMVRGVTKGFEKRLILVGVGYKAQAQGDRLNLSIGYSHPVVHQMPLGVKCETPSQTEIVIRGVDKQVVGQIAAEVRSYRKPEPYKGKGIRYANEVVVIKETKKK